MTFPSNVFIYVTACRSTNSARTAYRVMCEVGVTVVTEVPEGGRQRTQSNAKLRKHCYRRRLCNILLNTHAINSKVSTFRQAQSAAYVLRHILAASQLVLKYSRPRHLLTGRDLLLIAPPSLQPERSLFQHGPARWSEGPTGVVSASHRGLPRCGNHQHDHFL